MLASMDSTTQAEFTIEFPRFGAISYTAEEIIEFPWGIPGFPQLRSWLALSVPTNENFVWLQSLDDHKVAIPTADPYMVFEDYNPKLPVYAIAALDIQDASDFTVLCVVVVGKDAEEMTMNLFAPVVVNLRSRRARQIVLENSGYSVRVPMPRKSDLPVETATQE